MPGVVRPQFARPGGEGGLDDVGPGLDDVGPIRRVSPQTKHAGVVGDDVAELAGEPLQRPPQAPGDDAAGQLAQGGQQGRQAARARARLAQGTPRLSFAGG